MGQHTPDWETFHTKGLSRISELLVQPLFITEVENYSFSLSRVVNYLNKVRQLQHRAEAEWWEKWAYLGDECAGMKGS